MVIVKVICDASGRDTPHDGLYVKYWNANTRAGILEMESTAFKHEAKVFESPGDALAEWRTQSTIEPYRPWDGKPNRPLTGVTIKTELVE